MKLRPSILRGCNLNCGRKLHFLDELVRPIVPILPSDLCAERLRDPIDQPDPTRRAGGDSVTGARCVPATILPALQEDRSDCASLERPTFYPCRAACPASEPLMNERCGALETHCLRCGRLMSPDRDLSPADLVYQSTRLRAVLAAPHRQPLSFLMAQ